MGKRCVSVHKANPIFLSPPNCRRPQHRRGARRPLRIAGDVDRVNLANLAAVAVKVRKLERDEPAHPIVIRHKPSGLWIDERNNGLRFKPGEFEFIDDSERFPILVHRRQDDSEPLLPRDTFDVHAWYP